MVSFLRLQVVPTLIALILPASASVVPRSDTNTFADPKDDPSNHLKYIPSNVLTGIAFSLLMLVALLQTWCIRRWGAKWMLPLTMGTYCYALGFALRFGLHAQPDSKWLFICEISTLIIAPCAFIVAGSILLPQLAKHLAADQHLIFSGRIMIRMYVVFEFIIFHVQVGGAAMSAMSTGSNLELLGSRIFLAGLAAQLFSLASFCCISLLFLYRVYKYNPEIWTMDKGKPWYNLWRTLAIVLLISCVGVLICCSFRVAELSQGLDGSLATSEVAFYGLDTLPLFIAVSLYVPFWPGRFITTHTEGINTSQDTLTGHRDLVKVKA